ncbi:MAG: GTP 3',8-cyclase MoaA [Planctomycetes bacterium]|nr:GTP 3',8-cyclase MoaA [Planctomycetota bacterium]
MTADLLGRPLRDLRLSVTDRCNLRCSYCMPGEAYTWLPRPDLLTFEELSRLVDAFTLVGVDEVRLTGGEPLLRRDLARLVRLLAEKPAVREVAITTNGVLLAEQQADLRAAGLSRFTVSLDTLRPERFLAITRRDDLARVLGGIRSVAGTPGLKLDAVVVRGENDDELVDLLAFAREVGAELRFIEYMDVGGARRWSMDRVVSRAEMLARVTAALGPLEPLPGRGSAPAARFRLPDGASFGVVASTTQPFCRACDRSRVTADGVWLLCLYATRGVDLRGPLRAGDSVEALAARLRVGWQARDDRGAELRLGLPDRGARPLASAGDLDADPHLEMHTRGG